MNKILKRITLGAAVLLLVAAAVQPVQAACASGGLLLSIGSSGRSQIMTQEFRDGAALYGPPGNWYNYGTTPVDAGSLRGVFWAAGLGDPVVGAGNDNGSFDVSDWIYFYANTGLGLYYGAEINTSWASSPDIDGCITASADGCNCVLLTQNAPGQNPRFALLSAAGIAQAFFVLPGNAPVILADIPRPFIASSSRDPVTFDVSLGVQIQEPATGIYELDGCDCGLSFRPREIIVPRGDTPPADRNTDAWTPLGAPVDAAAQADVVSLCGASNTDLWLATELVVDPASNGGFGSPYVSDTGTRIECGPNLADPVQDKQRRLKATNPERGSRTGR